MSNTYTLSVYKKDRRYKDGLRLIETIDYYNYSKNEMLMEAEYLSTTKYKPYYGYQVNW